MTSKAVVSPTRLSSWPSKPCREKKQTIPAKRKKSSFPKVLPFALFPHHSPSLSLLHRKGKAGGQFLSGSLIGRLLLSDSEALLASCSTHFAFASVAMDQILNNFRGGPPILSRGQTTLRVTSSGVASL